MNFATLTNEERLLLGALIRLMVRADGEFSEAEENMITTIGDELTEEASHTHDRGRALWAAVSESAQHFPTDASIRAAIPRVTRPEARELIYAVLVGVASAETISLEERTVLDALRLAWSLKEEA